MEFKLGSERVNNELKVRAVSEDGRNLSNGTFILKTAH